MTVNEPRTNNPGLGNYVGRTVGVAIFLTVVFSFTAVHFYYSTSALLDLLAAFILFLFLFSLGLSMGCLVLCARVGPGELPSRFSAARMETFIRDELQRVVAKARTTSSGRDAAATSTTTKAAPASTTASLAAPGKQEEERKRWKDVDEKEEHQLANVASTAALTQRASSTAAEAELERMAVEARLRVHEARVSSSSDGDNDDEARGEHRRPHHRRPKEGGNTVNQQDGSLHNNADEQGEEEDHEVQELPAYMPEMMRLRRQRKIRRGLEVVRVSEAAQKVLQALDSGDFDRKREEMSYLIPGANWCRFCNYYQMNDTRHCPVCCRCVYRTKLHCVCCGNCIGYANSKYYVLFLFYFVVAFLMANFLDLYCVSWGYTYFFKVTGESNAVYYLVFVYSYAFAIIAVTLLLQYLLAAGRNVGLLTELLREQREEMESIQLRSSGEQYQMLMSERTAGTHDDGTSSPDQAREPFSWRRAINTVGEGLPVPLWFWPVPTQPTVKEVDDPEGFWTNLNDAIRIRLCSVADEDDVFTDEDEVDNAAHEGGGLAGADACPPSAVSASAPVPAPAVQPSHVVPPPVAARPPASVPRGAKSTDVTVVPVAVAVPPAATSPPATAGATAVGISAPRPSATSPAPPIARAAAPAPSRKMD
jgi:hypothetical protein